MERNFILAAGDYGPAVFMNVICHLGAGYIVYKRIRSDSKGIELVADRM
jgi:hypothetical protein